MSTQRLLNRKQRRKFRAILKRECPRCGITHNNPISCPLCRAWDVNQYYLDMALEAQNSINKNPNRVSKGAR